MKKKENNIYIKMDKQEFLDLYNKWNSTFMFSGNNSEDPAIKESYNNLKKITQI